MAALGSAIGAELWLEFVIPSVENFESDISAVGRFVRELGHPFPTAMVSPAPDPKFTLPGSSWPPSPPLEQCYQAARKAFPDARLAGGMFSFFTELNRKRPPLDLLDFVTWGQPILDLKISAPSEMQASATARDGSIELWMANRTNAPKEIELVPRLTGSVYILSANEFERATKDPSVMDSLAHDLTGTRLVLPPYAVARLKLATA